MTVTCSVIVPTHNRPALLAEALASVLAQRVTSLECIVVDDGSVPAVDLPNDPRLVLLRNDTPGGPAAARNVGLSAARGEIVTFLDDDDLLLPERLDLALEGLERAPVTVCVAGALEGPAVPDPPRLLEGNVHDVILDAITPHLGVTAVRRTDALRFDESFLGAEDVDWWLRTSQRLSVASVPRVGLLLRRHGGDRGLAGTRARIDGSLHLLDAHRDYFAGHPNARAFRWRRIGLMAVSAGDHALARRAQLQSLRARPTVRSAVHLARALRS